MGKHKIKRFSGLRTNPTGLVQEGEFNLEVKAPLATGDGSSKDVINSFVSNIVEKVCISKYTCVEKNVP